MKLVVEVGGTVIYVEVKYYRSTNHYSFHLTHWGWNKMVIFQMIFWKAFSCIKMYEFRLILHRSLFLRVQLTISQHWLRWWLGAGQVTSHYQNQWWLDYRCIYVSLLILAPWFSTLDCYKQIISSKLSKKISNSVPFHVVRIPWGQDKMATNFQTTFSNAFSWMQIYIYIYILIKISLKIVPKDPINGSDNGLRWPGNKPLSEPKLVSLLTHICTLGLNQLNMVCIVFQNH